MNETLKVIEKQVIKKITPSKKDEDRLKDIIQELIQDVEKEIKKTTLKISIELVGSTAKGTYLKENVDIDLFLLFPTTVSRSQLEETGLTIGRSLLKNQEECFAEHPYIRGIFKEVKTEIVPCYKIESASQKLSAVDRTPLHTKYIKEHLVESQKNEVRLIKQFLRGIGCYGAEAEIEGFSGYLCEILILYYSTFQSLIFNAQKWKCREKLKLTKQQSPYFDTPLIFIDPVDNNRNVASALSKDKFRLFILACRDFIKQPNLTFFFPNDIKPWPKDKIREKIAHKKVIGIQIKKPPIISENLYPQVRKALRSIKELCERYDFLIVDAKFHINKCNIFMILFPEKKTISKTMIHRGPPVNLKKNAEKFCKRWLNDPRAITKPFEKNKRLYIEIQREYSDITTLIEQQLHNQSLGKHLDKIVQDNFSILNLNGLLSEKLWIFWTEYLDNKMPWQR
jgi:tRNA nucleotidyltransferase (CCA-adding enzyme)